MQCHHHNVRKWVLDEICCCRHLCLTYVDLFPEKLNISLTSPEIAGQIHLSRSSEVSGIEAYKLAVDANISLITITASTAKGAMHGVQTLISLLEGNDGILSNIEITDSPR